MASDEPRFCTPCQTPIGNHEERRPRVAHVQLHHLAGGAAVVPIVVQDDLHVPLIHEEAVDALLVAAPRAEGSWKEPRLIRVHDRQTARDPTPAGTAR